MSSRAAAAHVPCPPACLCQQYIHPAVLLPCPRLQVLNDLLDPARTNLKLREDARRGVVSGVNVEGIREETLVSAEHALQVIAQGNEQRKVTGGGGAVGGAMRCGAVRVPSRAGSAAAGATAQPRCHCCPPLTTCLPACLPGCRPQTSATAFNEGSSRSHTIIRITIEASGEGQGSGAGLGWAGQAQQLCAAAPHNFPA